MFNVPQLLRYDLGSLKSALLLKRFVPLPVVIHIRAMDYSLDEVDELYARCVATGVEGVLVVQGDAPIGNQPHFGTTSIQLIEALKKHAPPFAVFAAFDPYKNLEAELQRAQAKRDVGVDGFFTQPFFSVVHMSRIASELCGDIVFWGLTPVQSTWSHSYWQRQNVIFPQGFRPTQDWNNWFVRQALDFVARNDFNAYLMPIKVPVATYLNYVFR
jgi:methylenetetrahydrofolate reductase (NADPH)